MLQTLDDILSNCEIYKIESDKVNYEIENLTRYFKSEKLQKVNMWESYNALEEELFNL